MANEVLDKAFAEGDDDLEVLEGRAAVLRRRFNDALDALDIGLATHVKIVHHELVVEFASVVGDRDIDNVVNRLEDLHKTIPVTEQQHQNSALFR